MQPIHSSHSNMAVSNAALEAVLRDIRAGGADYVEQFFQARPEWSSDLVEPTQQEEEEQAGEVQQ